jgi:hypothetical protein
MWITRPHFQMETLMMENSAVSGFFTGDIEDHFVDLFQAVESAGQKGDVAKVREKLVADLWPGQTIQVRLLTPVSSNGSRTGDPFEAIVTAPVLTRSRIVLPPGTKIEGIVFFAQKAPNKYARPRLVLDFANVIHRNGKKSPIFARVAEIDNARETVRRNEIIGIVQPHASKEASWPLKLAGMANPALGWAIEGVEYAYGFSLRREISLHEGSDLTLQVTGPSKLQSIDSWSGWTKGHVDSELQRLVQRTPVRTTTAGNTPSDLTNLIFFGSHEELEAAFTRAGWVNANHLNVASAFKTFESAVRDSGYEKAPVSLLRFSGSPPDAVFQKGLDTLAQRHHVRIWKQPVTYHGREVWIGAGTHDIGIGVSEATHWFHRIDSQIDRERAKIGDDLLFVGGARSYALVDRPNAPRDTRNATGDELFRMEPCFFYGSPNRTRLNSQKWSGRGMPGPLLNFALPIAEHHTTRTFSVLMIPNAAGLRFTKQKGVLSTWKYELRLASCSWASPLRKFLCVKMPPTPQFFTSESLPRTPR